MHRALTIVTLLCAGCANNSGSGQDLSVADLRAAPLQVCMSSDYVSSPTTINFGGTQGFNYSPKCLTVAKNTMVTWMGDFSMHPLTPSTFATPGSPIMLSNAGTSASFTFTASGFYQYYCGVHGSDNGGGMSGVVQVTP
jgi:plastocyanin